MIKLEEWVDVVALHRQGLSIRAIAREAVIARCQDQGQITLAEFRDMLDISRKFAQALLEYFDRVGLTRREGDYRVLRKKAGG